MRWLRQVLPGHSTYSHDCRVLRAKGMFQDPWAETGSGKWPKMGKDHLMKLRSRGIYEWIRKTP